MSLRGCVGVGFSILIEYIYTSVDAQSIDVTLMANFGYKENTNQKLDIRVYPICPQKNIFRVKFSVPRFNIKVLMVLLDIG